MLLKTNKVVIHINIEFIFSVLVFLCLNYSSFAQSNVGLNSRLLSSFDGLSSDNVRQTIEDKDGVIWMATSKGLNRYDGKNIVRYTASEEDESGLPHNDVRTLLMTQTGELWIGTQKGLVKKSRNDKFVDINNETLGEEVFLSDQIIKLIQAKNGNIWIAMEQGLIVISPDLKDFQAYSTKLNASSKEGQLDPGFDIADIFEDRFGNIWLSTWAGGITLAISDNPTDLHSYSFSSLNSKELNLPKHITFQNILQDEYDKIWLQEAYGSFYRLDIKSGNLDKGLSVDNIELSKFDFTTFNDVNNFVTTSAYIQGKGLFVSTLNGSYLVPKSCLAKDSQSNDFETIQIDGLTIGHDVKANIFMDSRNIVWISSNKGVFEYFGFVNLLFDKYPSFSSPIEKTKISGIYYDYSGTWLGTDEALYIDNRKELIEIKHKQESIPTVISFEKTKDGNLWMGTLDGKLYELEKIGDDYRVTEREISGIDSYIGNNHIWNILSMQDNKLWLATHVGIYIYDTKSHESYKMSIALEDFELYDFNCFDIIKTEDGTIYISATGIGLVKAIADITKVGGYRFEVKSQGDTKSQLSSHVVFDLDIYENEIWIAQNTGLEIYDIENDSFYRMDILDQSVNTQVYSVVASQDKVWATTPMGISSFSKKDSMVRNFNGIDGVIENHSMLGHYKDSSGDIFFAGFGGYHVVDHKKEYNKELAKEIVLSNLSINNQSVKVGEIDPIFGRPILTNDLNETDKITLSHNHENVVISFSVYDFISPHQYEYCYILKGISDEWIKLGQEQKVPFSQLPKEKFEIGFKAKDQFGQWTDEKYLTIDVVVPFWKRSTNIIWIGLLTFLVGYTIMKFRERKVKERNQLLEKAVQQRTIKLRDQNQKLEKYIDSNMKLENFAHAASHDLKAPLRNITAFASLLKSRMKEKMNEKEISYFSEIEKGTQRLNNLVDDILAYSKLKEDEIKMESTSISGVIVEVIDSLQKTIEDKNAKVDFEINNEFDLVSIDRIKIMRVLQNLMTNAIKFVPEDRIPEIKIHLKQDKDYHYIKVVDNGIGISEENQSEIFKLFTRVAHTSAYDGTGFGLTIAKKIMNLHKGDLLVSSTLNQGSVFTMQFPRDPNKVETKVEKEILEAVYQN